MPGDLKIWVAERKPKTGSEAGELADDYLQAQGRDTLAQGIQDSSKKGINVDAIKCHNCEKEGHLACNCPKKDEDNKTGTVKKATMNDKKVKCYNCGQVVHISQNCPDKALYCRGALSRNTTRRGVIEGRSVDDVVLDTGCSRTMVHRDLVCKEKLLEGEAVTVRCAHGDTVLYPLAEVDMELEGMTLRVKAAVADRLPLSVLLGTDVPEMEQLLRVNPDSIHTYAKYLQ